MEAYADNTGLMWELGAQLNALLVFAEVVPSLHDICFALQHAHSLLLVADGCRRMCTAPVLWEEPAIWCAGTLMPLTCLSTLFDMQAMTMAS